MTPNEIRKAKISLINILKPWMLQEDRCERVCVSIGDEKITVFEDAGDELLDALVNDLWSNFEAYLSVVSCFEDYSEAETVSFADLLNIEYSLGNTRFLKRRVLDSVANLRSYCMYYKPEKRLRKELEDLLHGALDIIRNCEQQKKKVVKKYEMLLT